MELKAIRTIGGWMHGGPCWIDMHYWRLRVPTIRGGLGVPTIRGVGMVAFFNFFKRVLRRSHTPCLKTPKDTGTRRYRGLVRTLG